MPPAQFYIGPVASQLEFERRISAIGERPQRGQEQTLKQSNPTESLA
jgi:hypothetical protein